jgi:FkbM family methyltransferase
MTTMTFQEALSMLIQFRDQIKQNAGNETASFLDFCVRNLDGTTSMNFQELFALFRLNRKTRGYFVEFGAGDGIDASNTYLLETRYEWTGIVAEPAKTRHDALRRNRNCAMDFRCVWSRSGETVMFNEPRLPDLSTIDVFSNSDQWASRREGGTKYPVETISLNDLLSQNHAPSRIDYLSIDTEGSELDILTAFDFDKYDVKVITVEHNFTPAREKIQSLLLSKGYVRKFEALSQYDDWYVKDYLEPSAAPSKS